MKSKSVPDWQDPSDSSFNAAGDGTSTNFMDSASPWTPPSFSSGPVIATPVLSAEAVESEAAQSGLVTPIALTTGNGITINLLFDAAAMAAPASFRAGIEQAATILSNTITDKITINLQIDYSGTGGGASAGPDNGQFVSYTTVRSDLINHETPGDTTFNALPTGSTIQGQSNIAVWNAQLKLFGLLGANDTTTDDGSATFATDINPNLLVGVALHELTHALGRVPYGEPDGPQPDIFDLYRFTGAGTRLFTDNIPAKAAYFSVDGGNTKIADYGQSSDPSDFLNAPSSNLTPNDSFNEFYNNSTLQQLTAADLKELDALGFHVAVPDSRAPTLVSDSPLSIVAGATQSITSSLLDASDNVSSAAQLRYAVTAAPADGTLLLNGVATTSFTQADINNGLVGYHETAGGSVSSDNFHFTVTDAGGNTTATESFQINIEQPPVVTIPSVNVSASANQVFAASSLFSVSDPSGGPLTYFIYDWASGPNAGHFVVNGVAEPDQTVIALNTAQLAQTSFVAGSAGASDPIGVMGFDGTAYSGNTSFNQLHVNVSGEQAPVVTIPSVNVSASAGEMFAASSLFSVSDPSGGPLTYFIYDWASGPNAGHFVVNGVAEPDQTVIAVNATQLAQTTFVAGSAGASDPIGVMAYDGQAYSGNTSFSPLHVNVSGEQAPVVTIPSANVAASPGQVFAASSLFSVSDPSGGPLTYFIYDWASGPNAGHFVVNGVAEPDQTVIALNTAQLAQTTFVAGSAGASDPLGVMAFDGQAYSGNTSFNPLHINVTLPTSPASPSTPAVTGDNFVFASSLDSAIANLTQGGAGDSPAFQAPPTADHVNTVAAIADSAPVEAMPPNAAVDPLAAFSMHAAGPAAGHFLV